MKDYQVLDEEDSDLQAFAAKLSSCLELEEMRNRSFSRIGLKNEILELIQDIRIAGEMNYYFYGRLIELRERALKVDPEGDAVKFFWSVLKSASEALSKNTSVGE